jgi:HAD superfamily 5'-nucleotidase-like hydrolase
MPPVESPSAKPADPDKPLDKPDPKVEEKAQVHLELLEALGQAVPRALDIERSRRIFVNRNLRMDEIDLIGFDMDYTLALYNQRNLEELSIQCTLKKMVEKRGYPTEIESLTYDRSFAVRGIVIDRRYGNIFKMDRYGHVGRCYHGKRELDKDERHALYRQERIRLSHSRYAWIDTLFALPEAVMYATIIDYLESQKKKVRFSKLWQDIRECIDEAHRDETMKSIIKANLGEYIARDADLAATLHKFRSSGKRLFLLTNSAWDYTDAVMCFLLDGMLPAYPSWKSYFDIIVVSGAKPAFFTEKRPFYELDSQGQKKGELADGAPFLRGRIYQGGNIHQFESHAAGGGDRVLYIGDHIYGDMLRAKKSSVWRTAMILQELEDELKQIDAHKDRLARVDHLERQCARLDSEVTFQQLMLKSLQRLGEATDGLPRHDSGPMVEQAKHEAKRRLDELRAAMKSAGDELGTLEKELDRAFNPYWGAIFREGTENSRFGEQVEDYACVYTSRVSNFLAYSPLRYFRSPRDHMPHELV